MSEEKDKKKDDKEKDKKKKELKPYNEELKNPDEGLEILHD